MRSNKIIHPELAAGLATLGHGDIFMVTDAGFPIPYGANRIDLGFTQGIPDVRDVLRVLLAEVFVENVTFAPELKSHHRSMYADVQDLFTGKGALFETASHEELIEFFAPRAKLIVRTGSFDPWVNFALTAATDPFAWFVDDTITILPTYVERRRLITENVVPDFAS